MTSNISLDYEDGSVTMNGETVRRLIDEKDGHYQLCRIPKRSGGWRELHMPSEELKAVQKYILNSLNAIAWHVCSHGFTKHRDIESNAREHVQAYMMLHMDIQDFFPSVTCDVLVRTIDHRPDLQSYLGDHIEEFIELVTYQGSIPQGAPTSPAVGNIVMRPIDAAILDYLVKRKGLTYTRYADDLIVSSPEPIEKDQMWKYAKWIENLVPNYGFIIKPSKTFVADRASRQLRVTGFVVNEKVNVDKRRVSRVRGLANNLRARADGGQPYRDQLNELAGEVAFICRSDGRSISGSFKRNLEKLEALSGRKLIPRDRR